MSKALVKNTVEKRGARVRRQVVTYFAPEEMPILSRLMAQEKRDGSSLVRWLVTAYDCGELIKSRDQSQKKEIDALRQTVLEFAKSQARLEDLVRVMQMTGSANPARAGNGAHLRVSAPLKDIGESGKGA